VDHEYDFIIAHFCSLWFIAVIGSVAPRTARNALGV
jgi:hypothetical protein